MGPTPAGAHPASASAPLSSSERERTGWSTGGERERTSCHGRRGLCWPRLLPAMPPSGAGSACEEDGEERLSQ